MPYNIRDYADYSVAAGGCSSGIPGYGTAVALSMSEMRAGMTHKASKVLTAILIAGFAFIASCEEEKIVYVPREVPADCPPSAPRGVYAVNLDGFISICWYPNPEDDIEGYDIWKSDELYGTYDYLGTVYAGDPEPFEYCFDHTTPVGVQYWYAVSAFDSDMNESDLSYNEVTATPRPEGLLTLYDPSVQPDACGYDFSTQSNVAQDCAEAGTDIEFDGSSDINRFVTDMPGVMIQDYGYTFGFDDINWAPTDGWSPAGEVEVVPEHTYILRLGEADGVHYVKLWVQEVVDSSRTTFWWAYQTDPGNRDLMPGAGGEGAGDDIDGMTTDGSDGTGGIKRKNGFPNGRRVPPTTSSGNTD